MCVSIEEAAFSGTIIYVGEVEIEGKVFNVLGYGNKAKNLSNSPNAMLLHFPAKNNLTKDSILDMSECKDILELMKDITDTGVSGMARGLSLSMPEARSVEFIQHGIYDILIAHNAKDIPSALEQISPEKRPQLKTELFDFYSETFPDWAIALCCFNNKDVAGSDPLFWYYEPKDEVDFFVFPAVDAHDGGLPNLDIQVDRDQYLVFGSYHMNKSTGFSNWIKEDLPEAVQPFITNQIVGVQVPNRGGKLRANGDFVVGKEDARMGNLALGKVLRSRHPSEYVS
jgi:hypothetical protein